MCILYFCVIKRMRLHPYQVKCASSSWSVPRLWRQPLEGLYLRKRSLILPNICVVRLVRSEQQWTRSVWQWQTLPLIWPRPSQQSWVDVRLCLSLVMENPQWAYAADWNSDSCAWCMFVKWSVTVLLLLFVCRPLFFVVHTHAGQSHDQSITGRKPAKCA